MGATVCVRCVGPRDDGDTKVVATVPVRRGAFHGNGSSESEGRGSKGWVWLENAESSLHSGRMVLQYLTLVARSQLTRSS